MVACGLNFTIAADNRNVLWFWGSSYKTYKNVTQPFLKNSNSVLPLTKNMHDETMIIKDFGLDESLDQHESKCVKTPRSLLA